MMKKGEGYLYWKWQRMKEQKELIKKRIYEQYLERKKLEMIKDE